MCDTVMEEKKKEDNLHQQDNEIVRFHGNDVKISKLRKKLRHKPRLFSPVLINLSIILMIISIILIIFYL